jgi:hypothetical protein
VSDRRIDPMTSLQAMHETGPLLAKARAERIYVEEYRKTLKALLMQQSTSSSAAMKEVDAYAHDDYQAHLTAIQEATEAEETLRWKMATAQAAIEVWRSQESSARAMDRSAA